MLRDEIEGNYNYLNKPRTLPNLLIHITKRMVLEIR